MDRYVRFARPDGSTGAGLLEGDRIAVIAEPFWEGAQRTGEAIDLADVRLLPPCQPRSIVCVGLNYASHLGGRPAPDPPTLFLKPLSSIAGPGDPIRLPAASARVDPEGEIVIVIGRELTAPTREEALAGIFGYTAGNDVSARDWQANDGQWWRAKGADTFGVFGPTIATGLDHDAIEVRTRANGVETQHGRSDELILDIPEIVRYTAAVMTLLPATSSTAAPPASHRPSNPAIPSKSRSPAPASSATPSSPVPERRIGYASPTRKRCVAMKKVVVDRVICLKAGQCYYLQPSIFKADSLGWPDILIEHPESDDDIEAAEDAAEICPSGAITIEDV